jgi:predicted small lipoprotein YifL
MQTPRLVLFMIAAALALSACGNKGPLVLPEKPAGQAPASDEAQPATGDATPAGESVPADDATPADETTPQDDGSQTPAEPAPQDDGAGA